MSEHASIYEHRVMVDERVGSGRNMTRVDIRRASARSLHDTWGGEYRMAPDPDKTVHKPRLLFRPDPVIGWSLSPDHAVQVRFRRNVLQTIDADGWRTLPKTTQPSGPRIAFYGCSFTYGTGLADDETYTALLQSTYPNLRILNRGIGGHGTTQNLMQFRRDVAAGAVDAAVFAMIGDHRFRNIAHPRRMRQYKARIWHLRGIEHVPVVRLDLSGAARIIYRPIWQPVIEQANFDIFLPDDYMTMRAMFAVIDLVQSVAAEAGVPVRFALLDQVDPRVNEAMMAEIPQLMDVSTPYDEIHYFLPNDTHPNARSNRLFAERLSSVVEALAAGVGA
ncbi:MAG: hypothetical protein AAGE03_00250 [Pseudomonadota bacterium]